MPPTDDGDDDGEEEENAPIDGSGRSATMAGRTSASLTLVACGMILIYYRRVKV